MYIYNNGKRKEMKVSAFLDWVHNDMYSKGFSELMEIEKEADQAKELQLFFQQLKDQAHYGKSTNNIISTEEANYILAKVQEKTKWKNPIFKQFGGYNLEKQLYQIIESVYEMNDIESSFDDIFTGAQHGTVFLEKNFNNCTIKALKDLTGKTAEILQNKSRENNQLYPYMMASVQRKTDIQGGNYQININWQESAGLKRILALLNQATFSAKNYSKNDLNEIEKTTGLKLGHSNPYRAIYASLSFLGFSGKTINSAFYAAFNSVKNSLPNNENVSAHIYHLRFIYELTGIGMNLLKDIQKGERAKFIIYNEPDTDFIYVLSTSQIIMDMLKRANKFSGMSAFTEGIYLNRSAFR